MGRSSFVSLPVCQSKTTTAGLLTAPSGLLASIRPPQARYLPSALEREVAHAAVIDPLPRRVVLGELACVEPPRFLAGSVVPFDHQSAQVGGDQCAAVGGEKDPVDGQLMAGQFEQRRAVGERPEADHPVVATRGDDRAVGAECQGSHPTAVRLYSADWLRASRPSRATR